MPRNHTRSKRASSDQHSKKNDVGLAAPVQKPVRSKTLEGEASSLNITSQAPPHPVSNHALPGGRGTISFRRHQKPAGLSLNPLAQPEVRSSRDSSSDAGGVSPTSSPSDGSAHRPTHITKIYAGVGETESKRTENEPREPENGVDPQPRTSSARALMLSASPARDTLALLIILFAVPSILLMPIQFLFAVLPFVSSAGTHQSWRQDPSFGPSGAPAVSTILLADIILTAISLCMSTSLRDFVGDLAHAVVAVSLGRDSSQQEISNTNLSICIGTVALLRALKIVTHDGSAAGYTAHHPGATIPTTSAVEWFHRLERLTAIHLVAQASLKWCRGCLVRQQQPPVLHRSQSSMSGSAEHSQGVAERKVRKNSHEQPHVAPSSLHQDTESSTRVVPTDRPPEAKLTSPDRFAQPFWAAVANTRLQVIRGQQELALSRTSQSRSLLDSTVAKPHPAPWSVCVSEILSDAIAFAITQPIRRVSCDSGSKASSTTLITAAKFPVMVKVDADNWTSIRVRHESTVGSMTNALQHHWQGWINDMEPDHAYEISFSSLHGSQGHTESFLVTTMPILVPIIRASDSAAHPSPTSEVVTPHTPAQAVEAAELVLCEHRAVAKRIKKEHKAQSAVVRKEIEMLKSKMASHDVTEEKQQRKILQANLQSKQHEEAIISIQSQLDAQTKTGHTKTKSWEDTKAKWEKQKGKLEIVRQDLEEFKDENERNVMEAEVEREVLQKTVDRLKARKERIIEQKASADKGSSGKKDSKKRPETSDSKAISAEIDVREQDTSIATGLLNGHGDTAPLRTTLQSLTRQVAEVNSETDQIYAELDSLDRTHPQNANNAPQSPLTPEGDIPGTVPRKFSTDHGIFAPYETNHSLRRDGHSRWPFTSPVPSVRSLANGHTNGWPARVKSNSLGSDGKASANLPNKTPPPPSFEGEGMLA